jgi:hypothetical protein
MKAITHGRIGFHSSLIALLIVSSVCAHAQDKDWRSAIQNPLESQYPLTKASADKSTIVTAGAILVLKKDNLVLYTTAFHTPPANTYKDGRITQGLLGRLGKTDATTSRTFVRGEKFWATQIEVRDDGVVFQFLSDPFDDVRYTGTLKFPFVKGSPPPADQIATTVAQVLKVDDSAGAAPPVRNTPAPAPVQSVQSLPPIPPPPTPPPDPVVETKSLEAGQTKDQVMAILGKPDKTFKVGTREIYQYKDVKVTFVNGKMTDAQ